MKAFNEKVDSLQQRLEAFNQLNNSLSQQINQWNHDCSKDENPNGLPTQAAVDACTGRGASINQFSATVNSQREALATERSQMEATAQQLDSDEAALHQRAVQYDTAKQRLIDDYNAQLVVTKAAFATFDACVKAHPADKDAACGTVADFTPAQVAKVPNFVPRPPLGVSASTYAGTWQGNWSGDGGFIYSFTMTLRWGVGGTLDGQINWTLTGVPAGTEFDAYRAKVGSTAAEYIRGTVDEASGYTKSDPNGIIGLDSYRFHIEKGSPDVMTGQSLTNAKDWSGVLNATRVKQ